MSFYLTENVASTLQRTFENSCSGKLSLFAAKSFEKYNTIWRQNGALLDVMVVALGGADMWIVTVTTLFLYWMVNATCFGLTRNHLQENETQQKLLCKLHNTNLPDYGFLLAEMCCIYHPMYKKSCYSRLLSTFVSLLQRNVTHKIIPYGTVATGKRFKEI